MKTNQGKTKNYVNQDSGLNGVVNKNKASAMEKFP